jgi:hypothetical protein
MKSIKLGFAAAVARYGDSWASFLFTQAAQDGRDAAVKAVGSAQGPLRSDFRDYSIMWVALLAARYQASSAD